MTSPGGDAPTPRRFFVSAFGDAGHALPAIALGRALTRRGHDVHLQTIRRWHEAVEREGMTPVAAGEEHGVPGLKPFQAAVLAARRTEPLVREVAPDVAVADILTVAGSLAAELSGARWATLIPHVHPAGEWGMPAYSIGARYPRSGAGRALWGLWRPLVAMGEEQGRREMNGARERVGLPHLPHPHTGISRELAIVATFPQLEYPRRDLHRSVRVTGPLLWEEPFGEVDLPPGEEPLVLVAPSTAHDAGGRLLRAALEGLAREPVRVLATTNRRPPSRSLPLPSNARIVDWVSYAKTMPRCAAVVCHAGHGTLVRALASGVPVVGAPAVGDMAENASRLAWSGAGVALPRRFVTPRGVRLAVRRLLAEPAHARVAAEMGEWAQRHDGGEQAARALEALAAGRQGHTGKFLPR